MAHSLGMKNICLPSKSYLSFHNIFQLKPHSSYLLNVLKCRNSSPVFPLFINKLDGKRSYSVLKINCLSGSSAAEVHDSIKAQVSQNPVVIYSKSWCPYCQEAKGLFQELGVKPFVVELDELGTGERQVQDALKALTGQSTVPNIFIGSATTWVSFDREGIGYESTILLPKLTGFPVDSDAFASNIEVSKGGKHIGGCSDTMELHQNGELASLLSDAGVNVS